MQTFKDATVTAYAYGRDNAFKGHPDGGDCVARTHDAKRRFGNAAHAVLGSGFFSSPSSMAKHPKSDIAFGSLAYVYERGWFVIEDVCDGDLEMPRFDMWSGPSTEHEMAMLTLKKSGVVVVYSDPNNIPSELRALGPSPAWTAHFQKMKQRIREKNIKLFVAP
jgi:hypothetical protein